MITKNLLFVFLLLFMQGQKLYSQDKQNDATWEETIDFLKEYVSYLNYKSKKISGRIYKSHITYHQKIKVDSKEIIVERYFTNTKSNYCSKDDIETVRMNLKDLIGTSRQGSLILKSNGNLVSLTSIDCYNDNGKTGFSENVDLVDYFWISLNTNDKNTINRIEKAFVHLAYLAKEKRQKSKF